MSKASLGQFAYEAYGDGMEWTTRAGTAMANWDDLPDRVRRAWAYAAWAVYQETQLACVKAIGETFGP